MSQREEFEKWADRFYQINRRWPDMSETWQAAQAAQQPEIDALKARITELENVLHPIANSHTENECTDRPIWWILDPQQNMKMTKSGLYGQFIGPFWSRQSAEMYFKSHQYRYTSINAGVYCGSCNDSPEVKYLFDVSKKLESQQ